jgi:putative ABC transport system permease protein
MAWIAAATTLLATPIALGLVTSFTALLPTSFPRLDPATLRLGVLILTPLYVLLGSLLVLTPSILAVLREDTRLVLGRLAAPLSGVSRRLRTVHGSFLFVQVALTVVLSIGASLLVVSVWKLQHVDVRFDKKDVLTLAVPLSDDRYPQDEAKIQFFDTALDRIRRLPGVTSAGMVSGLPFNGALMVSPVTPC